MRRVRDPRYDGLDYPSALATATRRPVREDWWAASMISSIRSASMGDMAAGLSSRMDSTNRRSTATPSPHLVAADVVRFKPQHLRNPSRPVGAGAAHLYFARPCSPT